MNIFLSLWFIFCAFKVILCQVESSFIKPVKNNTCGINTGGPIVQQLSRPLSYIGGLFWADDGEKIAYVDRFGPAEGRYTPKDGRFNRMQINEGFTATTMIPIKNSNGLKFVIGIDNYLVLANITGSNNNFVLNTYFLRQVDYTGDSFLFGKCDNKGRLWYTSNKGKLYRIQNLQVDLVMQGLKSAAGMAWTNNYKYFYLVDNISGVIYKFNYDSDNGTLSNRRIIFRLSNNLELKGTPYDLEVDTDGNLWISMVSRGSVIQYDEQSSKILWQIPIPATNVVSLEFGGLDRKTLYVGTAGSLNSSEKNLLGDGAMFAISGLGVKGFVSNEIVIPQNYL